MATVGVKGLKDIWLVRSTLDCCCQSARSPRSTLSSQMMKRFWRLIGRPTGWPRVCVHGQNEETLLLIVCFVVERRFPDHWVTVSYISCCVETRLHWTAFCRAAKGQLLQKCGTETANSACDMTYWWQHWRNCYASPAGNAIQSSSLLISGRQTARTWTQPITVFGEWGMM